MTKQPKTRKFYHVVVTRHDGTTFENPLQCKELHLISPILSENESVKISKHTCSIAHYNYLFGI